MLNLVKCVETDWNGFESCESEPMLLLLLLSSRVCAQVPQFFSPFSSIRSHSIVCIAFVLQQHPFEYRNMNRNRSHIALNYYTHSFTISSFFSRCLCWDQQIFCCRRHLLFESDGFLISLTQFTMYVSAVIYVVIVVVGGGVGKYGEEKKRKAFQLLLLGANIFSRLRLPLLCYGVCYVYTKLLLLLVIAFLFNFIRMSTGWNHTKCLQTSIFFARSLPLSPLSLPCCGWCVSFHIFFLWFKCAHIVCAHPKYLVCVTFIFQSYCFFLSGWCLFFIIKIRKVQKVYFFLLDSSKNVVKRRRKRRE